MDYPGLFLRAAAASVALTTASSAADDPLAAWRSGVTIKPVIAGEATRHTIHTYFNTCPESPDGKSVLFFSSTAPDSQRGDIGIVDRATGEERVLVKEVHTEDAHRVACQQWISNGKRVVYHNEQDGQWRVETVDLDTGKIRVLAPDRLVCWGQPTADLVPLYGKHWNPGSYRDLELLNVATGEIKTVLTVDAVNAAYPDWIAKAFAGKPTSIFFPELSPDLKRVYFKMAAAGNGNPFSGGASTRLGLVAYDLEAQKLLFKSDKWGHPAWHPDSRRIVEVGWTLIDSTTGKAERLAGMPNMGSGHPSSSPDSKLIVTDLTMDHLGGNANRWAIVVGDAKGGNHVMLHEFDNARGAKSWRRSHPHPVFSADGRRIYFNVSSGPWTQLYVAECGNKTVGG